MIKKNIPFQTMTLQDDDDDNDNDDEDDNLSSPRERKRLRHESSANNNNGTNSNQNYLNDDNNNATDSENSDDCDENLTLLIKSKMNSIKILQQVVPPPSAAATTITTLSPSSAAEEHSLDSVVPLTIVHDDNIRGSGVGKFCLNNNNNNNNLKKHFESIRQLFTIITEHVPEGITWGEGDSITDPRRRRYAFLPDQRQYFLKMGIKLERPPENDEDEDSGGDGGIIQQQQQQQHHEHELAMSQSMDIQWEREVSSGDNTLKNSNDDNVDDDTKTSFKKRGNVLVLPLHIREALIAVTEQIRSLVSEKYKKYVTLDQLIAAQPNHHNGAKYLPAHLDFPRHDGFGIVIATIGISNVDGSDIILIDEGDDSDDECMSWSFPLNDGECYFLSGNARNKCSHGVISRHGHRATLNLRYGLHSKEFAHDEIWRHWPG